MAVPVARSAGMNTSTEARARPFKIVSVVLPIGITADVKATARAAGISTSRFIRRLVEAALSSASTGTESTLGTNDADITVVAAE